MSQESKWKDMPEPKALVTLSWEDIAMTAECKNISLSRQDVIDIMEDVDCTDWDSENSTFWEFVLDRIRRHVD